ncbi:hypothetical protein XPN_3410, partial [Xanthomonas arboricola pv. pruni MAFF 301427]
CWRRRPPAATRGQRTAGTRAWRRLARSSRPGHLRVQGHPVRRRHRRAALPGSRAGKSMAGRARCKRLRGGRAAAQGQRAHQRGLPVPQRVDAGPARWRQAPDPVLYPRRRLHHRLRQRPVVRRRASMQTRRCGGDHRQSPAQPVRLPVAGAAGRCRLCRLRQCRAVGPDPGAAVGAPARGRIRRRCRQCHRVRPVRWRRQDRHPDGDAGRAWPVPPCLDHERAAGHRGRPACGHAACAVAAGCLETRARRACAHPHAAGCAAAGCRAAARSLAGGKQRAVLRPGAGCTQCAGASVLADRAAAIGQNSAGDRQYPRRDACVSRQRREELCVELGRAAGQAGKPAIRRPAAAGGDCRISPAVSAVLAFGCVLRRDHGGPLVARRGRGGRGACTPGRTDLGVSAGLGLAAGRRQVRRLPHAGYSAGLRHHCAARLAHRRRRRCAAHGRADERGAARLRTQWRPESSRPAALAPVLAAAPRHVAVRCAEPDGQRPARWRTAALPAGALHPARYVL